MKSLKAILYLFACVILVSGIISCGGGGSGGGDNNSTVLTQIKSTNHKPGSTLIISGTGFDSINSNSKLVCNNTEFPIIDVNDSHNQLTSVVPIESDCYVYLAVSSSTSSNSLSLTIGEGSLPNNVTAAEVNSKTFNTLSSVNVSLDDTVQSNALIFGFSATEAQQISDELKNTEALLTAYNNYVENNLTAAEQEQLAELYYNAGIYDLMSELDQNSTPLKLALSIRSASGNVSAKSVDASSLNGVVFLDYVSAALSMTRVALAGVSIVASVATVAGGAGVPVATASELLRLKLGIADSVIDGILMIDLKSITTSVPLNLNVGQDLDFTLIGTFAPQSTLMEATLEGLMLSIDVENADALIEEVLNIALSTVSGYAVDQVPYVNDLNSIVIDSMEIEFDASYYMGYQTVLNVLGVGLIFEAIDKLTFGSSNLTVDAPVIADTNVAVMSPDYKTISGVGQGTTTLTVEGLVLNEIDLGYLSWLTFGIEAPEAVVATIPITVSETVDVLPVFSAISGGHKHSIALKTDGTVWSWGRNQDGQLGYGNYTDSNTPEQVSILTNVSAIATGNRASIALKTDGTVWAWGVSVSETTLYIRSTPEQVWVLTNVSAIVGGQLHSIALKTDGTVWAWSSNYFGQLGDGTNIDSRRPVQVGGLTDVSTIAGGGGHSIALKTDGTVWAWGWNNHAQLGDGTNIDSNTPVLVSGLTDVSTIAGGGGHSIALKTDGTVWTWGSNGEGQLGDGTYTDSNTPVQVSGLTNVSAIVGGAGHTTALKADGTVWTWGYNGFGQLGDGTTTNSSVPVLVSGLANVSAIAGSVYHSIALKTDGTVWAWGYNEFGQLGDGTNIDKWIPTQISYEGGSEG